MPAGTVSSANSDRHLQAVEEVARREHVAGTGRSRRTCSAGPGTAGAVEAEVEVLDERIEDEDAEDQRATGSEQQVAEPAPRAGDVALATARLGDRGAGRPPARRRHGVDPVAGRRDRTRAASSASARSRCTPSPAAGTSAASRWRDDHQLAVVEPADDVALVAERLDHRRPSPAARPSSPSAQVLGPHADHDLARARAVDGARERGGSGAPPPGSSTDERLAVARRRARSTVFIGGLPMKRATNRFAGRVVDLLRRPDLLEHAVAR